MWRSLVARLLWEQDVAGSNPVIPTIFLFESDPRPCKRFAIFRDLGVPAGAQTLSATVSFLFRALCATRVFLSYHVFK